MDDTPRDKGLFTANRRSSLAAPNLASTVREARTEAAQHSEVVAELRGAEFARLEMLQEAMRPVLAQVPDSIDLFDTGLVPGDRPRYHLDMIAFVEMGRDRRTYRFVQDTRHGRIVLAESEKVDTMVERMTAYVARRLVEREQALASDQTVEQAARAFTRDESAAKTNSPATAGTAPPPRRRFFFTALLFVIELLGSIVLFTVLAALCWFGWQAGWHWWSLQQGG